jgi:hypothetical protein
MANGFFEATLFCRTAFLGVGEESTKRKAVAVRKAPTASGSKADLFISEGLVVTRKKAMVSYKIGRCKGHNVSLLRHVRLPKIALQPLPLSQ